jgi:peptide/nickel transport system substrate-binding protein
MVLRFDRGYEESVHFDLDAADELDTFFEHFMGWRIASQDPLVVEFYTDAFAIDAENNVTDLACAYPFYNTGPAPWHTLALGLAAEQKGEGAFSEEKAAEMGVEWLDYVDGPTLGLFERYLSGGLNVPYPPALLPYVSQEEIAVRLANLENWYRATGHFWVGTGPYLLREVTPGGDAVVLGRYEDYPDPADRWLNR